MMLSLVCFTLALACSTVSGQLDATGQLKSTAHLTSATENYLNIMNLDGTKSSGNIAHYEWELLNTEFKGHTVSDHSRVIFKTTAGGIFRWQLTVCDDSGHCDKSYVVSPHFDPIVSTTDEERLPGPRAVAHMSITKHGDSYTMDLSAERSSDDKDIMTYKWEMTMGDNVGLTFETPRATYVTENPGTYRWELKVCDTDALCSMAAVVGDATFN